MERTCVSYEISKPLESIGVEIPYEWARPRAPHKSVCFIPLLPHPIIAAGMVMFSKSMPHRLVQELAILHM